MSLCLVTGGAGFIGSSLARALLARGDKVRIIDNFSSGKRENLADFADKVDLIEGDILDDKALARAVDGAELIFHEAAIPSVPKSMAEPVENHAANATGTIRVLEQARRAKVRRVVYAASSAAYGEDPVLPKVETMAPAPISPYGGSKLAGEQYMQIYARAYGLETVCLRYFNVFGPRQDPQSEYAAVIPKFITVALAGKQPRIFGDGSQSRDFCYIDNVIEANFKAASADARQVSGGVFNVACGQATDLNRVVALIGDFLGKKIEPIYEDERAGDIKHSWADISAARARLGYTAGVSFAEGLGRTIDWYKARLV
ncbi:MAG TPA: SDR family oxidoreductase [Polyangia bacterium]|nr:SDR family oxidoreductase [Polyangia bacterium]HVY39423.1 SDR family oxidoreductase [Polyangia bacterium]